MADISTVSFIIVAYRNAQKDLDALYDGLNEGTQAFGSEFELIIVQNDVAQNVGGLVSVQDESRPNMRRLSGLGNIGFAAAVAVAVNEATGQYVVLVNPDCGVVATQICKFLSKITPENEIVVPCLLNSKGEFDYQTYEYWTFTFGRIASALLCKHALNKRTAGDILPRYAKVCGAFVGMYRSTALTLNAPFDEQFYLYAEDRDLTRRARALKIPIKFWNDVLIEHRGGESGTTVSDLVERSKVDGSLRFARRRYGRIGAAWYALDVLAVGRAKRFLRDNGHRSENEKWAIRRWVYNRFNEPVRLNERILGYSTPPRKSFERLQHAGHASELRVLVLWSDPTAANYGLRVLAEGSAQFVRSLFPENRLIVDYQDFGPGSSAVSFGTRSILKDVFRRNGPIKTKLGAYDLIVDSGAGDSFTDIYGLKRLSFILYAHWCVFRLKKPLVFSPQTIGPFGSRFTRLAARVALKQASAVYARDTQSAAYSKTLGRVVDASVTDLVFALPSVQRGQREALDVLVNVSGLLWFSDTHFNAELYRAETISLVRELEVRGRTVSLLAHVINSPRGNDDVDACHAASALLPADVRRNVSIIIPDGLEDAREILADAKLVIGARMHACLNAISVGTPAVPWAYSRKFGPLLQDIGWPHTIELASTNEPAARTLDLVFAAGWDESERAAQVVREFAQHRLGQVRAPGSIGSISGLDEEEEPNG
mgnify:CR=1 FL=1